MKRSHSNKAIVYSIFAEGKCAHPDCTSGINIEIHHILPKAKGGPDHYWNFISLCRDCHRHKHLHSNHKANDVELFTWKSMQELRLWGFNLDENDVDYYENLKRLVLKYVVYKHE